MQHQLTCIANKFLGATNSTWNAHLTGRMTYILKEIEDMKKQNKYWSPYFDEIRTNHKSYSKVFFAYIK